MRPERWMALGAVWAALAVGLGAMGAHALEERLAASDGLDNWRTAASYQLWHALALVLFGLERRTNSGGSAGGSWVGWCFFLGSLAFSGSIYGLSLQWGGKVLGPVTPLGGVLMIAAWLGLARLVGRRYPVGDA